MMKSILNLISILKENEDSKIEVSFVDEIKFDDFMILGSNVLKDLNIFTQEIHPSLIKGKG